MGAKAFPNHALHHVPVHRTPGLALGHDHAQARVAYRVLPRQQDKRLAAGPVRLVKHPLELAGGTQPFAV